MNLLRSIISLPLSYLFPSPADANKPITTMKKEWTKVVSDAGIKNLH